VAAACRWLGSACCCWMAASDGPVGSGAARSAAAGTDHGPLVADADADADAEAASAGAAQRAVLPAMPDRARAAASASRAIISRIDSRGRSGDAAGLALAGDSMRAALGDDTGEPGDAATAAAHGARRAGDVAPAPSDVGVSLAGLAALASRLRSRCELVRPGVIGHATASATVVIPCSWTAGAGATGRTTGGAAAGASAGACPGSSVAAAGAV